MSESQESAQQEELQKRQENEATIKALASVVRPVRQLYVCEVCDKKWMKLFFVTKLFKGFPKVRFCGKPCRRKRHETKTT